MYTGILYFYTFYYTFFHAHRVVDDEYLWCNGFLRIRYTEILLADRNDPHPTPFTLYASDMTAAVSDEG